MHRIDCPSWATVTTEFEGLDPAVQRGISDRWDELLAAVDVKVGEYVVDIDLVFDDPSMFPSRAALAGEYFVRDARFWRDEGSVEVRSCVTVVCLASSGVSHDADRCYLGLDVWFDVQLNPWLLTSTRNTDSFVA